jgi:hypothetical protein
VFSDLPKNLKTVLGAAILAAIIVTAAGFRLSFIALRDVANNPQLKFGHGNGWLLPILVDFGLVASEIILLGASMVRVRNHRGELETYDRTIPFLLVLAFGGTSLYFNVTRVPAALRAVTVIPPAGSILMTIGLAYLVKMLARISGADHLYEAPPLLEPRRIIRKDDVLDGEIVRPDLHPEVAAPPPQQQLQAQPQQPELTQHQMPGLRAKNQPRLPTNRQNGQAQGARPGGRKAEQHAKVIAYLEALQRSGGLDRSVTGRQVTQATKVSLRTVQPILRDFKQLAGIPTKTSNSTGKTARKQQRGRG